MSIDNASTAQIKPPGARKGKKPPKRITPDYLHNSGLYYLQRFAAGSAHFRTVMMRKVKRSCHFHKNQNYEACAEMVEDLIKKFERSGLLNDQAYTGGIVSSYRRRGLSKQAILSRLKARGIETAQGLAALSAYDEDNENSEIIAALTCARKKRLGPFMAKEIDDERQLAALARQGFSYDTAQSILKMDKKEAEEILANARL